MGLRQTQTTIYAGGSPAATPVSAPGTGGIRFDSATGQWVISENGGAWTAIGGGSTSPWQQVGTVVSLVDAAATNVSIALAGQDDGDDQVAIIQTRGGPLAANEFVSQMRLTMTGDAGDDPASVLRALVLQYDANGGAALPLGLVFDGGVGGGDDFFANILGQATPIVVFTTCETAPSPISLIASGGLAPACPEGSGITLQCGDGDGALGTSTGGPLVASTGSAGTGSGLDGADADISMGDGDGGGRAGLLRVSNVELVAPPAGGFAGPFVNQALPPFGGGIYLESAAVQMFPDNTGFIPVPGPWTDTHGQRGDTAAIVASGQVRTGITGGWFRVDYDVTFEAIDPATFTFAIDFGFGTIIRGRASHTRVIGAGAVNASSFAYFAIPPGVDQAVRLAVTSSAAAPGAEITVSQANLSIERKA